MTDPILGAMLAVVTAAALAWKWGLGVGRTALVVGACAVAAALALALLDRPGGAAAGVLVWAVALGIGGALVLRRFYRDPERTPPALPGLIVSPADGEVVYVRRSSGGVLPAASKSSRAYTLQELTRTPLHDRDAVVVGIGLSFLDVHVNRSPLGGQVVRRRHHSGRFASLRRPEAVFENERATLVIERDGLQIAVVLIASRLVRRIVTFVREGERVRIGQRIGAIRFGSQVDLVLPAEDGLAVVVRPGDRLTAGETIVATAGIPAASRAVHEAGDVRG
jgi:phosphatidylserine decarboxylase